MTQHDGASASPRAANPANATLLGDYSVERFMREHWQKQPLFLPQAIAGFRSPLEPDELAGLACDPDVESRLVEHTERAPWQLRHGPFEDADFEPLGNRDWTLLVQDVDKHVPAVAKLLALVRFLPSWCIDDIMISFAAPGGSVGPHIDRYDVFLLQAEGSRLWQIGTTPEPTKLRSDTDLKVLQEMVPTAEFLARPGDVLYLPPGVAHFGIAQDPCLTLSFGFRSPSRLELASQLCDAPTDAGTDEQVPILVEQGVHRSALPEHLLAEAQRVHGGTLTREDTVYTLGRILTEPKETIFVPQPEEAMTEAGLLDAVKRGENLVRDPASRWLFAITPERVVLFVHGDTFELTDVVDAPKLAEALCDEHFISMQSLHPWLSPPTGGLTSLLVDLYAAGYLKLEDEL